MHEMLLHPEPFSQIRNGTKRYELRLFDEKRAQLKVGDVLLFRSRKHTTDTITTHIVSLKILPSFLQVPQHIPIEAAGWPKGTTGEEVQQDMRIYYSLTDETHYGVVIIEIEKTK